MEKKIAERGIFMIDITVLVPGIRTANWLRLYESVGESFSGSWEMLFISPYDMPDNLVGKDNVRLIKDWGTPIKCQQRGLVNAHGEYITWAADDGYYMPGVLDIAHKSLFGKGIRNVVVGKYTEGEDKSQTKPMLLWDYYRLKSHASTNFRYVPSNGIILNVGLVPKELLFDVGGWDCQFEVCPMAYSDLSIRLNHYCVRFIKQEELMFCCGHMPMRTGDHGPIHDAQTEHDEPLMSLIYNNPNSVIRLKIPLDNWEKCDEVWGRRFTKSEKK